MTVITFGDTGLPVGVLARLLGMSAWNKIFAGSAVGEADAIPFQVRQLVGLQLRGLAQQLKSEQHEAAREKGAKAMKKTSKKCKEETLRLKKHICKA